MAYLLRLQRLARASGCEYSKLIEEASVTGEEHKSDRGDDLKGVGVHCTWEYTRGRQCPRLNGQCT